MQYLPTFWISDNHFCNKFSHGCGSLRLCGSGTVSHHVHCGLKLIAVELLEAHWISRASPRSNILALRKLFLTITKQLLLTRINVSFASHFFCGHVIVGQFCKLWLPPHCTLVFSRLIWNHFFRFCNTVFKCQTDRSLYLATAVQHEHHTGMSNFFHYYFAARISVF